MIQHDQINVDAGAKELIHELTVDGICDLPEVRCFDPKRYIVVAACARTSFGVRAVDYGEPQRPPLTSRRDFLKKYREKHA